jgi:hypothetical protein
MMQGFGRLLTVAKMHDATINKVDTALEFRGT